MVGAFNFLSAVKVFYSKADGKLPYKYFDSFSEFPRTVADFLKSQ